jgi:hypothetical protein
MTPPVTDRNWVRKTGLKAAASSTCLAEYVAAGVAMFRLLQATSRHERVKHIQVSSRCEACCRSPHLPVQERTLVSRLGHPAYLAQAHEALQARKDCFHSGRWTEEQKIIHVEDHSHAGLKVVVDRRIGHRHGQTHGDQA